MLLGEILLSGACELYPYRCLCLHGLRARARVRVGVRGRVRVRVRVRVKTCKCTAMGLAGIASSTISIAFSYPSDEPKRRCMVRSRIRCRLLFNYQCTACYILWQGKPE